MAIAREFEGPNFPEHGYASARYRAYGPPVELTNDLDPFPTSKKLKVPSRLEVLTQNGEWKQHPIVFINKPSEANNYLVVFHYDGRYNSIWLGPGTRLGEKLLKEAEQFGLTKGQTYDAAIVVAEAD